MKTSREIFTLSICSSQLQAVALGKAPGARFSPGAGAGQLLAQAVEGELELLCWCHPLPCHAEVVRGAVLWLAGVAGLGRGRGDWTERR